MDKVADSLEDKVKKMGINSGILYPSQWPMSSKRHFADGIRKSREKKHEETEWEEVEKKTKNEIGLGPTGPIIKRSTEVTQRRKEYRPPHVKRAEKTA